MARRRRPLSPRVRNRRLVVAATLGVLACLGAGIGLIVDHHGSGRGSATTAVSAARGSVSTTTATVSPARATAPAVSATAPAVPATAPAVPATAPAVSANTTAVPPTTLSTPSTSAGVPTTPVSGLGTATSTTPASGDGLPLTGMTVAIDPGHNGGNFTDPAFIDHLIWNGRQEETCDTTGTETDAGYTEALYNFLVANDLAADLQAEGAHTVLTRQNNTGVGPCVTERAAIGNDAHANAAISIHADGGPATGRGFTVLEPVADGVNDAIIGQSATLGADVRTAMLDGSGEPVSDYYGTDGLQPRDDLGGLNLSTVPKVLIECANMRNQTDADLITSQAWQQTLARALAAGITSYLEASPAA